jgi:hypothetical protein
MHLPCANCPQTCTTGMLPQPHTAGQRSPELVTLDVLPGPERMRSVKPAGQGAASGRAGLDSAEKQPSESAAPSPTWIGPSPEVFPEHARDGNSAVRQNSDGGTADAQSPWGNSLAGVRTADLKQKPSSAETAAVRDGGISGLTFAVERVSASSSMVIKNTVTAPWSAQHVGISMHR